MAKVLILIGSGLTIANRLANVGTPGHISRYGPHAPDPVIESNYKPWYQDRKYFKNKKSRRKL